LTVKLSPINTGQSNTTDNVKAKIDNIKAKIEDKEEKGPWSRPTLAFFDQLAASSTSSPLEGSPRQVSALHNKFPPHTTSLRLAREDRLRLARGPGHTTKAHGVSTTTDVHGGTTPHAMKVQQLAAMQAAHPDRSLNAGLIG
jgi:hypothetical protein